MVDAQRVADVQRWLAWLGVSVADLREAQRPLVPTIAEYLPRVIAAAGPGARRTYGSYWDRVAARWGDRRLDSIAATDVEALQREAAEGARRRRNGALRS
jgi:hypothetical protein